jgi:hypothetical protein
MRLKKIKKYGIAAAIFLVGAVGFFNNTFGLYQSALYSFSSNLPEPFSDRTDNLRLLVFPFKNFSAKTDSNLSEAIFEKINQIKSSYNLNKLELKYYPLPLDEINEISLQKIAQEMKADMVIWGSYELSANCNSSICLMNFSVFSTESGITQSQKLDFESVINSVESGRLTEPLEFYIYYVLGILEYENGGKMRKSFTLLDKAWEIAQNEPIKEKVKKIRDKAALHLIIYDDLSPDLTPEEAGLKLESDEYGLRSSSPVFVNGLANCIYYLESLRYKNHQVETEEIELFSIDSLSPLNNQVLVDRFALIQNRKVIDTVYIYLYSKKNFFKPPHCYEFVPQNLESRRILYGEDDK